MSFSIHIPSPRLHPRSAHPDRTLARQLGVWSAIGIVIGSMIGSGIFRVPSATAAQVGTPGGMMLVWVVGGLVALCGALTLAELAALYPRAGGIYVYLNEAYGSLTAFLVGWLFLVIAPASIGAVALVFAEYLGRLFPVLHDSHPPRRGRRGDPGGGLELSIPALRAPRFRICPRPPRCSRSSASPRPPSFPVIPERERGSGVANLAPESWTGFGLGLVTVLWAYNGWQDATYVGGEVRDPGRNLPRALTFGTLIVTGVYLAVNAAYLSVLPDGCDRAISVGRGRRGRATVRRDRQRVDRGAGLRLDLRHDERRDHVLPADLLRHGGGPALLSRDRGGASTLWHAARSHRAHRGALRRLPVGPDVRAAHRDLHPGLPAVLGARGGCGHRHAPPPARSCRGRIARLATRWYRSCSSSRPWASCSTPCSSGPGPTLASFAAILAGVPVYYLWRRR